MRKVVFLACLAALAGLPARADEATRQRVGQYFTGWYSVCPGTRVTVTEAREIAIPGFEAYRVERACELKNRNESNVALVDGAHKEKLDIMNGVHSNAAGFRRWLEGRDPAAIT